jgi:hypothetical protein
MWLLKLARGLVATGRHGGLSSGVGLQRRISKTKPSQSSMPPMPIAISSKSSTFDSDFIYL